MSSSRKNIQNKTKASPKQVAPVKSSRDTELGLLAGVAVIIFICFHYSLNNQYINTWDDWIYVSKNPSLVGLTKPHLFSLLFQNITRNLYHPITMVSYAVNYHFSALNPWAYFFTEILIHIANAIMIFYFAKALIASMEGAGYKSLKPIPWLLAALALWHGIHPMHVESVSWLSERKDLLYAFFYFLGLLFYLRYLKGEKTKWMAYVNIVLALFCVWGLVGLASFSIPFTHSFSLPVPVVFVLLIGMFDGAALAELKIPKYKLEMFYVFEIFLFSLLSKPMAVAFPLSLLAIDVLLKRDKHNSILNLIKEKWMFIATAFLSGILSISMQAGGGAISFTNGFTVIQKFLIACYGFMMYTCKFFLPTSLCSYYPYPSITSDHYLPQLFYCVPLIVAAMVGIPLYLAYKKNKDNYRVLLFCILFYFVNLVFILQFLSAGFTIIADRYSYVAYFGLLFMVIYFAHWYWYKSKTYHLAIQSGVVIISIILGYLCYERTKVWHSTKTLWEDVTIKYPMKVEVAYKNLGSYYTERQQYDSAYIDYATLEEMRTKDPDVYAYLGNIWAMKGDMNKSLEEYNKSLSLNDTTNSEAYLNRAITYCRMGQFAPAIVDYNHAFKIDSTGTQLLVNRGYTYLYGVKNYDAAIADYSRLIKIDSTNHTYYLYRGLARLNKGDAKNALVDFDREVKANPKNGDCLFDMSLAYKQLNDYADAMTYAEKAQQNGAKLPDNYIAQLQRHE